MPVQECQENRKAQCEKCGQFLGRKPHRCASRQVEAVRSASEIDVAWFAGFFEGDGYCYFNKTTPRLHITQVNRWPLERIMELFGGAIWDPKDGHVSPSRQKYRDTRNPSYWYATGERARQIMRRIYLYLSPKRQLQVRRAMGNASHTLSTGR